MLANGTDKNTPLVTNTDKKIAALHVNSKTPEWIEED